MIPKIIHYSWFSGNPYPDWIQDCINTWKIYLPDYELVLWNMERLKEIDSVFVEEAISMKKWAFAADYVRLYAIEKYGGIWLDTDIEVFKSFNCLLDCKMFIGKESWPDEDRHVYLTSHCFGAESHHPFVKECLDYYRNRHFIILSENTRKMDMTTISKMQALKALRYGLDWRECWKDKKQVLSNGVIVYPSYFFCRPLYTSMKKVYCIHRCAGAWRGKEIDGRNMTN
jgi:hypothetical protein